MNDSLRTMAALLAATWLLNGLMPALDANRRGLAGMRGSEALAVLAGMRPAVAGGFWLKAHRAWERREADEMRVYLVLAVEADAEPLYFWRNGARMLAYDPPAWLEPGAPIAVKQRAADAAARTALAFLTEGRRAHPASAELWIEAAMMQSFLLRDRGAAAESLRRALALPGVPYYAARLRAELLRESGRSDEALAQLRKVLPSLPADDPAACRAVVEQRIKALEAELAGR